MKVFDVCRIVTFGEAAYGKGTFCPRDGRIDASILDVLSLIGYSKEHKNRK